MPASTRLRAAGAVIAGCLFAGTAPSAPAQAAAPLISVAMAASGTAAPRYDIQVRNGTDGMVRTTVRQELPPGARPALISEGGQVVPAGGQPGQAGTAVVWQVQLAARSVARLTSTLVAPPAGTNVTAPACAFVANGNMPYDCATATWDPTRAAAGGGSGTDTSVRAEPASAVPWWRSAIVLGTAVVVLLLLATAGGLLWSRRLRRRRAAGDTNTTSPDGTGEERAQRGGRRAEKRAAKKRAAEQHAADRRAAAAGQADVRRSGSPIARARARVRGDAKIPVPDSVRRATGHPRIGDAASHDDPVAYDDPVAHNSRIEQGGPVRNDAPLQDGGPASGGGLLRNGGLVPNDDELRDDGLVLDDDELRDDELWDGRLVRDGEPDREGGLVGIAGGARYVGQAAVPPRTPVPDDVERTGEQPPVEPPPEQPEVVSPAVGRARPRPHPATAYRPGRRRAKPPAWAAVGLALLLAVAFATATAWAGSSQVSAISGNRQPSSGAWVGKTVAGPVGTSLRESAFEFTVYRLLCPPAPAGCQAIVGVRNLTDKSQQWHGTLQRAYLPTGDWVGADVPATQTANAGKDPFADPVPAGERMILPLVFPPAGPAPPTRIELRSAVFSAGVSVAVPR
jgi:hypothetical protein